MKRILCWGLTALFLAGCVGGEIISDPERDELIIKISGRRVGAEIAENHPEIATTIKQMAERAVIDGGAVVIAVELLSTAFPEDPLLRADLLDLLAFVPVDPAIDGYVAMSMQVIYAIVAGIELWEGAQE